MTISLRRQVFAALRPYRAVLGLLADTLLLSGSIKGANVVFSYVNRDLMTALTSKNAPVFFHTVLRVSCARSGETSKLT